MTGIVSTSRAVVTAGGTSPVRGPTPTTPTTPGRAPTREVPRETWVKIGLLAAAFVALFCRWIATQAELSALHLEDWGHAFVIPLISGYMVWQQREKVFATPASTFWPGLGPMLLGVVCYFFFIAGVPNHMCQGLAMILTLGGMTLLLVGPRVFRYLFLPIAFLVFCVTIAEQVMIKVTFQLQHIAAVGAWMVLRIFGLIFRFPVDIDGNTLYVGATNSGLNVAEACSGMRMVIAFVALAAVVAVFGLRHWWQRAALVMLAVPVAVFNNVLRVAVLGLLQLKWPSLAAGQAHMLIGTVLLVLGLGMFLGIQWVLNRIVDDGRVQGARA